jgi:hypothetical protein
MKLVMVCFALVLSFFPGAAHAGEIKELELKDGSVVAGEVLSLSNGIYTVKSDILGTIKLEETKVRTIRERSSSGNTGVSAGNNGATGEVKSLQQKMMSDKEIMNMIRSLQNDPEFKKLMEDPEFMKAVNAGDVAALTADPRFTKLLANPTVQEIQKKVK